MDSLDATLFGLFGRVSAPTTLLRSLIATALWRGFLYGRERTGVTVVVLSVVVLAVVVLSDELDPERTGITVVLAVVVVVVVLAVVVVVVVHLAVVVSAGRRPVLATVETAEI